MVKKIVNVPVSAADFDMHKHVTCNIEIVNVAKGTMTHLRTSVLKDGKHQGARVISLLHTDEEGKEKWVNFAWINVKDESGNQYKVPQLWVFRNFRNKPQQYEKYNKLLGQLGWYEEKGFIRASIEVEELVEAEEDLQTPTPTNDIDDDVPF